MTTYHQQLTIHAKLALRRLSLASRLGIVIASLLWSTAAFAQSHQVEFCIEIATSFIDNTGGDFWTTNDNRIGRGVWLDVIDNNTGVNLMDGVHYVGDKSGCTPLTLDANTSYTLYSKSFAKVNGIEIQVHVTDLVMASNHGMYYDSAYVATGPTTEVLVIPAYEWSAQLAVATWAMNRNHAGLNPSTPLKFYNNDCCYSSGGAAYAKTVSKTIIAHELGHLVSYLRDGSIAPKFSYALNRSQL